MSPRSTLAQSRPGRRPGPSQTREHILAAARDAFAAHGYPQTSVRAVARAASVDPSLVLHFFGSKAGLFEAALELPVDPQALVRRMLDGDPAELGTRVVGVFLGVWDSAPAQGPMLALLRGAVSHDASAALLREAVSRRLLGPLTRGAGVDRPQLRAGLVASQLVGLALTRYVLRLSPLAGAAPSRVAALIGPTVQGYLTGPLGDLPRTGALSEGRQ